jgi:diketogulonate reductase-like aldo/keto reductase
MSPVSREQIDQIKGDIRTVLGETASDLFLRRVDAILEDWAAGKHMAVQACEKVQKLVSLFIDEGKAREIGSCFAPIVMRETASGKK